MQMAADTDEPITTCVVCGSTDIREIRCKIVCGNCGTILKTCAD